jgi:biotin operon repressor
VPGPGCLVAIRSFDKLICLLLDCGRVIAPVPLAVVAEAARAGQLLKPLRLKILAEAREPHSAAAIAARLGLPRQKVNYHVRELARAGFLRRAGRQRKRGLTEQKYVVTAQAFLFGAGVLGPMSADMAPAGDKMTAAYLLMLAAQMQREAGIAWRDAHASGKSLPVLSIDAELYFSTGEERAQFARALAQAVTEIVGRHSVPAGAARSGARPYRLVLGCYPLPKKDA